jgi:hypothetical protein
MFIVERLTSRSSVALSVSIGYARSGGGRRAATRSRGPDEDAHDDDSFRHLVVPSSKSVQVSTTVALRGVSNSVSFPRRAFLVGSLS